MNGLRAALDDVAAGEGRAVGIEAGAGLGKTRLLQEVRGAAESAGLKVLAGRATELERNFPFALVRQLFEPEVAALPAAEREAVMEGATAARGALGIDADRDRGHDAFAVLHALYWVTAALAERMPLLLAIDDAHWADAASLDYLGFLLPRLEDLPVLLVVTGRPDEPDPPRGFRRIMTDPLVRHMTLAPLGPEATTVLLARELGREPAASFAAACLEVAGGNPFLLRELARTLTQRGIDPLPEHAERVRELVPERVAHTVLMRIERLPPEAEAVARALALLGDGTDPRLVAELAEIDSEAIVDGADSLRASAILDTEPPLRFIHPLVRNAIYADIPAGERGGLHARAATLLREHGAPPEQIATQLLVSEARGDRETVDILVEAGERALANGAPDSAVTYLMRALREPSPADLRPAVLYPLIRATFRAADHAAWTAVEPEVLGELERDPSLLSRWAGSLTVTMAMSGRFEEAASMLVRAVEVAAAEGDVQRAFQLESQLATIAQVAPTAPKVDLTRYAGQIEPDSPVGRLAAAIEARSAVVDGNAREATDAAKRALGNDAVIFAEEPEIVASVTAVMMLIAADEVEAAERAVERAFEIAHEEGGTPIIARALHLRGLVAWASGDLVNAEMDMRQATDLVRMAAMPPLVLMYTSTLVEVLIERDELERAEEALQALGMAEGPMPANPIFSMLLLARGHLRFERGELEQSLEDLLTLSGQARAMGLGLGPAVMASPWSARALVATGEREKARELADEAMAAARRWGAPATVAHVMRAVAAARGGPEGVERLEEAAALLEGSPRRLEHAHALTDLGAARRREGRRTEARAPLREAFELARQCGAARIAKRAHAELQATGEAVRRYTPTGVESLTPSERRVAELAASGMTNRQIAQSLFVTVKTVEAHLSAAYGKLDIDSRRQLPAILGEAEERA